MANYVCYPMTKIEDRLIFNVQVPASTTLYPGNVVMLSVLPSGAAAITSNYDVFAPTQPTTANLITNKLAIVVQGGNFNTLSDGRRPAGAPDYTNSNNYSYQAGDICTVVALEDYMRFYISDDCLTSSTAAQTVGGVIVGANTSYTATSVASSAFVSTAYKQGLTVLARKSFRLGGNFGAQFASGSVAMVKTL